MSVTAGTIRSHPARRHGYVLVVTLGLLVLSATVMVGVSRAAIRHAAAAREAREDLQRRYGSLSIRAAVLAQAESLLAIAEANRGQAMSSARARLRLGGQNFQLILSDEQAKANLNALLVHADATQVQSRLREALSGTGLGRLVHVRSAPPSALPGDRTLPVPRTLNGIGQIFDLTSASPESLLQPSRTGPAPLDLVTLWGDGRINLRRASVVAARLALAPPLSSIDVDRLLSIRQGKAEHPADVGSARPRSTDPLRRLLEDAKVPMSIEGRGVPVVLASSCWSVWVIADDGRRKWYELGVIDRSEKQSPIEYFFSW